jgi:hypothetical protein
MLDNLALHHGNVAAVSSQIGFCVLEVSQADKSDIE